MLRFRVQGLGFRVKNIGLEALVAFGNLKP
jgi:hypothetical protein